MPLFPTNLEGLIENKALKLADRIKISYGLACAVEWLHRNDVIHRDIKSANVLVDDDMNGVLCDFSLIKFQEEKEEETGKGKKAKKAAKKKNKMMNEKFDGEAVGRITQEVEFEEKMSKSFRKLQILIKICKFFIIVS